MMWTPQTWERITRLLLFTMNAPKTKHIFIVGPSSAGKTTLCSALSKRLGIPPSARISEVARTVMKKRSFTREDIGKLEMQRAIIYAQLEEESNVIQRLQEDGGGILLSDRSAIDAVVYAMLTANDDNTRTERWRVLVETPEFQHALQRYRHSTVILLKPVPEWLVDDGVRSIYNQEYCGEQFLAYLNKMGVPFYELGLECLDIHRRVELVMDWATIPKN